MSLSFESLTLIGEIKRQLGYSYPYKAGSATVHTPGLSKKVFLEIIKYYTEKEFSITINTEKKTFTISGYCPEF